MKEKNYNYLEFTFKTDFFVTVHIGRTDTNLSKLEVPFEIVLLFGTCVIHIIK